MTRILKWLGGGVAAVMLLGLAGLFSGEVAEAQPSGPPHRFAGAVTVDGEAAAAGTSVTAIVNGAECGSATVIESAAGSTYAVDVPDTCADAGDTVSFQVMGYDAAESGTWGGGLRTDLDLTVSSAMPEEPMDDMGDECPDDMAGDGMGEGEGDAPAEPDEPSEPSEPSEPAEPMDDMGDDMADDCPTDDMGDDDMADDDMADDDMTDDDMTDDDMAPEAGDTGTGLATSTTSTSSSLAAILGVTALAILLGSYAFARRRR